MIRTICHYLSHAITIIESNAIFIAAIIQFRAGHKQAEEKKIAKTKGCSSTQSAAVEIDWPEQRGFERKKPKTIDNYNNSNDDDIVISSNRFMCAALKLFKIKYKARSLYFIRCVQCLLVFFFALNFKIKLREKKEIKVRIFNMLTCAYSNELGKKFSGSKCVCTNAVYDFEFDLQVLGGCQLIVNILLENADWWWRRRRRWVYMYV